MGYRYRGRVLCVDLNNPKIEIEEKDDMFYRTYSGGRGIGQQYLLKEVPFRIYPFLSENTLVLATQLIDSLNSSPKKNKRRTKWTKEDVTIQGKNGVKVGKEK